MTRRLVVEFAPGRRFREIRAGFFSPWHEAGPQGVALFLLGLTGGLALGVALLSARLDAVSLEREQLRMKAADLAIQVERLKEEVEEARYGWGSPVVSQVDLNLEGMDELTRVRVRAEIAPILEDLVGRPVSELDPALAFHLLEERVVTVEGQRIDLSVRAVVIGPETKFWVELGPWSGSGQLPPGRPATGRRGSRPPPGRAVRPHRARAVG